MIPRVLTYFTIQWLGMTKSLFLKANKTYVYNQPIRNKTRLEKNNNRISLVLSTIVKISFTPIPFLILTANRPMTHFRSLCKIPRFKGLSLGRNFTTSAILIIVDLLSTICAFVQLRPSSLFGWENEKAAIAFCTNGQKLTRMI